MTSSRCSPFPNNHQHFANCTAATANRSFDVIRCFEHIMINYSVLSTSVCSENQQQPKCAKSSFTLVRYVVLCYISCVCTYVLSLSLSLVYSLFNMFLSILYSFLFFYHFFHSICSILLLFILSFSNFFLNEFSPSALLFQDFRSRFDGV